MNIFDALASAALVVAAAACPVAAMAGTHDPAPPAPAAFDILAGTAVPTAQLAVQRARGIVLGSAIDTGTVTGNSVGPDSATGTIANANSINNNAGVTTVFQNTGNNSLIQNSTAIYITVR